jgi:ribosomal protein S12 methylthiotransferase accessory factor YcaO
LIERRVVLDWWQHGGTALQLAPPGRSWAETLFGRDQGRGCDLLVLGDQGPAITVLALSFRPDDHGFCFGAATRTDLASAVSSASKELVQAEFGLALSEAKLHRHGPDKLGAHDRLALQQAAALHRSAILNTSLATVATGDLQSATTGFDPHAGFQWRELGQHKRCLTVVKVAEVAAERPESKAAAPVTKALTQRSTIPLY